MASACFPRRLCGLCRLPGHNRSNCNIIDLNDSSHVDDGPAGNSIVNRIRRERAERIRANGLKPMTKEEYCMAVYGFTCQDMHDFRREDAPIPLPDRKAVKLSARERRAMTSQRTQAPTPAPAPAPQVQPPAAPAPQDPTVSITVSDTNVYAQVTRPNGSRHMLSFRRTEIERRMVYRGQTMEQVVSAAVRELFNRRQENDVIRNRIQRQISSAAAGIRQNYSEFNANRPRDPVQRAMEQSMRDYSAPLAQATGPEPTATEPVAETECPICMEPLTKTNHIVGKCGHQFHASCLCQSLRQTNACPCCRQQVV